MRMNVPGGVALLIVAAALNGCDKSEPVGPETIERVVRLSPHKVYSAFATSVPQSGVQLVQEVHLPNGEISSLTAGIAKVADQSIEIAAETPRMRLFHIRMQFLPLDNGRATRVRALVEVDPAMVRKSADMSPRASMDMLKTALNRAIDTVAAGQPLKPMPVEKMARESSSHERPDYAPGEARPAEATLPQARRPGEAETIPMRRGMVVPMQSAEPMLDPNAVARQHRFSGNR